MKLVLSNGVEFCGLGRGPVGGVIGEVIFNTSMVGYQEIFSDPSYAGQIVVMTYPLMGQYGIADEDFESRGQAGPVGIVVRQLCDTPSNFRFTKTLGEWMEERGVPCLWEVDTRMITRVIRDNSPLRGAIVPESVSLQDALQMIASSPRKENIAKAVSCTKRWFSRTPHHKFDVVVVDCGLKRGIVRELNERGCNVTVVPFDSSADEILSFNPGGVLLSSGPGTPDGFPALKDTINALKGRLPLAGIGLGHQFIGMSYGASIIRLGGCGHHGGCPVKECSTGRIFTAELNHTMALDPASINGTGLEITYLNALDGCVEGVSCAADKVITCEFTPEGGPGPQESTFFDEFIKMMEE